MPENRLMPRMQDVSGHALEILQDVLRASDPRSLVMPHLPGLGDGPFHVVAAGKAARAMCAAAGERLGEKIRFGICVSGEARLGRPATFPATVGLMHADHPLPTQENVEAAEAVKFAVTEFGEAAGRGEAGTLLVLISGGGSAHLTLPGKGLTLEDLRGVTGAMLRAGATIQQINCVRKHVEQLKGGRLAAMAHPGTVKVLVMSDVSGDPLDVIASGPFAPDPTTYGQAVKTLRSLGLLDDHSRVADFLERGADGEFPESPKPGDSAFEWVTHTVIGNNQSVTSAAVAAAERLGFRVARVGGLSGPAREAGQALVREAIEAQTGGARGVAIVLGGEATVKVEGSGSGGRNQETALAAAIEIADRNIAVLTFATDGVDGPTDAAGGLVTGQSMREALKLGMDPGDLLRKNDSYTFLAKLDRMGSTEHIKPGATGTNLCDLAVALVY